jgi:hypothetical protein
MIAVKVLFKRTAKDGFISVGGEGPGEDRDVSKCRFEGFVEDI